VVYSLFLVKTYDDYTREERAELMLTDYEAYAELLTPEHWFLILDGISHSGPLEGIEKED
jgi:hypothetical protein